MILSLETMGSRRQYIGKFKVIKKLSTQNSVPRKIIFQKWRNNKRLSQTKQEFATSNITL